MYMTKSNKMKIILSLIIIIAIILIPEKDLTAKEENYFAIILSVLFFIYFAINLYKDITNIQYSTAIFIIVVDVIEIVALIALCYLYFKNYDKTNVDIIWKRKNNIQICTFFLLGMLPIKSMLKNQKLKK